MYLINWSWSTTHAISIFWRIHLIKLFLFYFIMLIWNQEERHLVFYLLFGLFLILGYVLYENLLFFNQFSFQLLFFLPLFYQIIVLFFVINLIDRSKVNIRQLLFLDFRLWLRLYHDLRNNHLFKFLNQPFLFEALQRIRFNKCWTTFHFFWIFDHLKQFLDIRSNFPGPILCRNGICQAYLNKSFDSVIMINFLKNYRNFFKF